MQTLQQAKTTINVQLPDEFEPEYSVDGLDVSVEGNVLSFKAVTESRAAASVKPGKYTLTIKDKKEQICRCCYNIYIDNKRYACSI